MFAPNKLQPVKSAFARFAPARSAHRRFEFLTLANLKLRSKVKMLLDFDSLHKPDIDGGVLGNTAERERQVCILKIRLR